jgi:hypothetical protein
VLKPRITAAFHHPEHLLRVYAALANHGVVQLEKHDRPNPGQELLRTGDRLNFITFNIDFDVGWQNAHLPGKGFERVLGSFARIGVGSIDTASVKMRIRAGIDHAKPSVVISHSPFDHSNSVAGLGKPDIDQEVLDGGAARLDGNHLGIRAALLDRRECENPEVRPDVEQHHPGGAVVRKACKLLAKFVGFHLPEHGFGGRVALRNPIMAHLHLRHPPESESDFIAQPASRGARIAQNIPDRARHKRANKAACHVRIYQYRICELIRMKRKTRSLPGIAPALCGFAPRQKRGRSSQLNGPEYGALPQSAGGPRITGLVRPRHAEWRP